MNLKETFTKDLPYPKTVTSTVIAFIIASGGWGGYQVVKDDPKYGVFFDSRLHTVERVIDGDTFVIENNITVRLLALDAPELGTCYGAESTSYLKNLIEGKKVYLKKDISGTDPFGRLLRYATLLSENPEQDDIFINNKLIKNGYAIDQKILPDIIYSRLLTASRNTARKEESGMWKHCPEESFQMLEGRDNRSTERLSADAKPQDPNCIIKGNISTQGHGKTYFFPGCSNYSRVMIDPNKGEQYFCTEAEAQLAGFTISTNCTTNFMDL